MLCPQCGASVDAETVTLCEACRPAQTTEPEEQEAGTPASASAEEPPKVQHVEDLYADTLGRSQWEDVFSLLTHPACLALLGVISFLFVYLVLLFAASEMTWYVRIFITGAALFYLAYLYFFIHILMQLLYADQIAFFYCIFGLIGMPFAVFLYADEVGWHRIKLAGAMLAGAVLCCIIGIAVSESGFSTLFDIEELFSGESGIMATDADYERAIKEFENNLLLPGEWRDEGIKHLRFLRDHPELELYQIDQMDKFGSKIRDKMPQTGMSAYYAGRFEQHSKRQRKALEKRFLKKYGRPYRPLSDYEAERLYREMEYAR
ncbi:MAG TPA: hypothetical protein PLP17_00335 [Oligoflexia bacterium]|nr:hypothetical protein [Oligoflexia bacterium]